MKSSKLFLLFSKLRPLYKELIVMLSLIHKTLLEIVFWFFIVFIAVIVYTVYKNFDIQGLLIIILFCVFEFIIISVLFFEDEGDWLYQLPFFPWEKKRLSYSSFCLIILQNIWNSCCMVEWLVLGQRKIKNSFSM